MEEHQIKQIIGQLEASIDKIEPLVTDDEFQEYCDNLYSLIAMWRTALKRERTRVEQIKKELDNLEE